MAQLKFDKKTGNLSPQKVNYVIKHNELDNEMIDKYLQRKTDFSIDYDNEGNAIFIKKEKMM